jgi:molecular chaperone HtpG
MLQQDHQLRIIAKAIEKKIKNELVKMLKNDREKYDEFFKSFGVQLKWGVYADYGMNKDNLKDLIMFKSSNSDGYTTLKEYVDRMADSQDTIYYACGDSAQKIALLPQCEAVKNKGYEILYFTDDVDEFAIQMLMEYDGKKFANICKDDLNLSTDAEKEAIEKKNTDSKDLLEKLKNSLGDEVSKVQFSNNLGSHPVCLSAEGYVSLDMARVLAQMPNSDGSVKAQLVLEINAEHPIAQKLSDVDDELAGKYAKILYAQARLIAGLPIDNPTELTDSICSLML